MRVRRKKPKPDLAAIKKGLNDPTALREFWLRILDSDGSARRWYEKTKMYSVGSGSDLVRALPNPDNAYRILEILEEAGAIRRLKLVPSLEQRFFGAGGMWWRDIKRHPEHAPPTFWTWEVAGPWPGGSNE